MVEALIYAFLIKLNSQHSDLSCLTI